MMRASIRKPTRHDRSVVKKPPISGPTAAAIARRGADERVDLRLHLALEVAVDQRLHRGEVERGAEPADDGPEDEDRDHALGEHHRERADRVEDHADHVGALAAEEIADLAADEDEGGGHERLDRHRRLDGAHGRVEVLDDGRDRHVHQRRVDDEDEHRRRQQDAEERRASRSLPGLVGRRRLHVAHVRPRPARSSPDHPFRMTWRREPGRTVTPSILEVETWHARSRRRGPEALPPRPPPSPPTSSSSSASPATWRR